MRTTRELAFQPAHPNRSRVEFAADYLVLAKGARLEMKPVHDPSGDVSIISPRDVS